MQTYLTYKEPGKCEHFLKEKSTSNANPAMAQMLKLSHKYCKAAIESCPQGKTPSNGNIELVDREIETTEKE